MNNLKNKIQNFFTDNARYRGIPPVLISTFLSIFPIIVGDDYKKWAGLDSVELLTHIAIFVILVIATLGYMAIAYEKEWKGYWHWKKKQRYLHYFSFGFFGITAAMIPYYAGVSNFFFGMLNYELNGQMTEYLPYLWIYAGFYSFIAIDLFNSCIGKSFLFKIPPINRSPVKNYSYIECKIKKHFPEKISNILLKEYFPIKPSLFSRNLKILNS